MWQGEWHAQFEHNLATRGTERTEHIDLALVFDLESVGQTDHDREKGDQDDDDDLGPETEAEPDDQDWGDRQDR